MPTLALAFNASSARAPTLLALWSSAPAALGAVSAPSGRLRVSTSRRRCAARLFAQPVSFGAPQGALLTRSCPRRARTQAYPVRSPRAGVARLKAGAETARGAALAAKPSLLRRLAGAAGHFLTATAPASDAADSLAPVAPPGGPVDAEQDEQTDLAQPGTQLVLVSAATKAQPKAQPKRVRLNDRGVPAGTTLDVKLAEWVRSRRAALTTSALTRGPAGRGGPGLRQGRRGRQVPPGPEACQGQASGRGRHGQAFL